MIAVVVWGVAPAVTWFGWGVDQLESYLTLNALPVGLVWNGMLAAALVQLCRRRYARLAVLAMLALTLWIVGHRPLSIELIGLVEKQYPTKNPVDFEQPFRAIVMLGGCTRRLPNGRPEVSEEGQRVVTTAEFWHAGKTAWIVTTGRRHENKEDPDDPAVVGTDLLVRLGVPAEKILQLPGRNTAEEITAMSELLQSPPADFAKSEGRVGLVTSAFHMPRAMKLASNASLNVIPLPSGHRWSDRSWEPSDLIPNAGAISNNTVLVRESLARLVGR